MENLLYVLKLVQWAVASGATRIDVTLQGGCLRLSHDGGEASLELLQAGLAGAKQRGAHSVVREGGVVTIEGLPRQSMHRLAPVGTAAVLAICFAGSYMLHFWPWMLLAVPTTWHFLRDLPQLAYSEFALLRFRCQYCPVPLLLNGRPVNQPWFGLVSRHNWVGQTLDIVPAADIPPERRVILWENGCRLPAPDPSAAPSPLTLWGKPTAGCRALVQRELPGKHGPGPASVKWVKHGAIVCVEALDGVAPGFQVVADAYDLEVEGFQLVRDARYDEVLARLRGVCSSLGSGLR